MQEIGRILKEKREELGMTLEDVQQATKIRTRYLEAIEAGNLSALPGMVYARGFIKSYAEFLGLDGQQLLDEYGNSQASAEQELAPQTEEKEVVKHDRHRPSANPRQRSLYWQMLMGLGIVGLILIVYLLIVDRGGTETAKQEKETPTQPPTVQTQPPAAPAANKGNQTAQTTPLEAVSKANGNSFYEIKGTNITLEVSAARGENWMRVEADGQTVDSSEILKKGESRTFHANKELVLITGNAPAVDVKVNGQPVVLEKVTGRYSFHFRVQ